MAYPRSLPSSFEMCRARRQQQENLAHSFRNDNPANDGNEQSSSYSTYPSFASNRNERQRGQYYNHNAYRLDHSSSREYFDRDEPLSCHPSPFPRRYHHDQPLPLPQICVDDNMNYVSDEGLQPVSQPVNQRQPKRIRSQICAEFVSEHFKCPICLDVLIETTTLTCGHRFCRLCIETWIKSKPICPVCETDITTSLKDYHVDNAINSVAIHLSDEWKTRRRRLNQNTPSNSPNKTDLDYYVRKTKRFGRKGCRFVKNAAFYTGACCLLIFDWLYKNISLQGLAKGVMLGCFIVFLLYFNDQIVNFLQYMYYAARSYERNIPLDQQIAVKYWKIEKVKPTKYQEFVGLKDTIFALFLSSFYNYE